MATAGLIFLEVMNGIRIFENQGGLGRPKGMNQAGGMSMHQVTRSGKAAGSTRMGSTVTPKRYTIRMALTFMGTTKKAMTGRAMTFRATTVGGPGEVIRS